MELLCQTNQLLHHPERVRRLTRVTAGTQVLNDPAPGRSLGQALKQFQDLLETYQLQCLGIHGITGRDSAVG